MPILEIRQLEKFERQASDKQTKRNFGKVRETVKRQFQRQPNQEKDRMQSRPTVCVSCVLPREPAHETENVFRAEKCP